MKDEFANRIDAQREVLRAVNSKQWTEELFGLAGKAIQRWKISNSIREDSRLLALVREASAKLFFLANRSQEQITDDYACLSKQVRNLIIEIAREIESIAY